MSDFGSYEARTEASKKYLKDMGFTEGADGIWHGKHTVAKILVGEPTTEDEADWSERCRPAWFIEFTDAEVFESRKEK